MISVLAIDDEPFALQQITAYINKIPYFDLVKACQSAAEALEVMQTEMIDAIFVDINMPDLNGMDFVKQLALSPLVVFTTAYSEYAVEGFKVDAVDYLLKPFGLQDFQRASLRVKERYDLLHTPVMSQPTDEEDTLFFKTEHKVIRVNVADIRYVEAMSEYLKLYLDGRSKPVVVLLSMKKLEDRLPSNTFMRIHRSFIVNLKKIQEVNKNRIIIDKETYLPIGDSYRELFNAYLESRFIGKS